MASLIQFLLTCNLPLQVFVVRKLSKDLDLGIYNRMLSKIQHDPKFSQYFAPTITNL